MRNRHRYTLAATGAAFVALLMLWLIWCRSFSAAINGMESGGASAVLIALYVVFVASVAYAGKWAVQAMFAENRDTYADHCAKCGVPIHEDDVTWIEPDGTAGQSAAAKPYCNNGCVPAEPVEFDHGDHDVAVEGCKYIGNDMWDCGWPEMP